MRYLVTTSVLMAVLGACAPKAPNDGEFFGHIVGGSPAKPASGTAAPVPETIVPVDVDLPSTPAQPVGGTTVTQTIDRSAALKPQTLDAQPTSETITLDLSQNAAKEKTAILPEGDGSISNSQDFTAVKANETIESDAAKLEALKSQYKIIQPGAAPRRTSDINLAQFALGQSNPVGQKAYSRFGIGGGRKAERKCATYSSADDAQTDFLRRGGPNKDALGLDPDGDGYACSWSPVTYKALLGAN